MGSDVVDSLELGELWKHVENFLPAMIVVFAIYQLGRMALVYIIVKHTEARQKSVDKHLVENAAGISAIQVELSAMNLNISKLNDQISQNNAEDIQKLCISFDRISVATQEVTENVKKIAAETHAANERLNRVEQLVNGRGRRGW